MQSNRVPFDRWCFVITGYLQNQGTRTRLVDLWHDLHDQYCGPSAAVRLCPWNHAWDAEAEFVFRLSVPRPKIAVIAYSWGGGWGFTQLAKRLQERALVIDQAVLIDPVYRHPYPWGQWRTLFPAVPIMVSDNVREVHHFRQTKTWPRGHNLMAERPRDPEKPEKATTLIHPPRMVNWATHQTMDDHSACIGFARKIAEGVLA